MLVTLLNRAKDYGQRQHSYQISTSAYLINWVGIGVLVTGIAINLPVWNELPGMRLVKSF